VPAFIGSFETPAKPMLRRALRSLHAWKSEVSMTAEDIAKADRFIEDRYIFAVRRDQTPDLRWFLDLAEVAAVRHGAKIVQIDPWNRFEHARANGGRETETEYVNRALRECAAFAKAFGVHFQIVAHPAKMDQQRKKQPPDLEDVAGSKHWENISDQGFAVHRPQTFDEKTGQRLTEVHLYHRKARFEDLGYQCRVELDYDLNRRRYFVPGSHTMMGTNVVAMKQEATR
jgi:twinkle protein